MPRAPAQNFEKPAVRPKEAIGKPQRSLPYQKTSLVRSYEWSSPTNLSGQKWPLPEWRDPPQAIGQAVTGFFVMQTLWSDFPWNLSERFCFRMSSPWLSLESFGEILFQNVLPVSFLSKQSPANSKERNKYTNLLFAFKYPHPFK